MLVMLVFEFDDGFTVQFFNRLQAKTWFQFFILFTNLNRAQKFSRVLRTRDIFYYYRNDMQRTMQNLDVQQIHDSIMIQNKYKNITVSVDQEG